MTDLSVIRRIADWVRFLEVAESTISLARAIGHQWADGSPSITIQVLEFDEYHRVINKHLVAYHYLGAGRCYLACDDGDVVRVSADTTALHLPYSDSQRMLAIASAIPLFDRLCAARVRLLTDATRRGISTNEILTSISGTFDTLLEGYIN